MPRPLYLHLPINRTVYSGGSFASLLLEPAAAFAPFSYPHSFDYLTLLAVPKPGGSIQVDITMPSRKDLSHICTSSVIRFELGSRCAVALVSGPARTVWVGYAQPPLMPPSPPPIGAQPPPSQSQIRQLVNALVLQAPVVVRSTQDAQSVAAQVYGVLTQVSETCSDLSAAHASRWCVLLAPTLCLILTEDQQCTALSCIRCVAGGASMYACL